MTLKARNNVHVKGTGANSMLFAHGFGCDQNMWRFVAPAFEGDFRTVLFDHVGAGGSDLAAYNPIKYSTLAGYADDVVELGRELGLQGAVFVGHSVSAMIGVLASIKAPGMFSRLVLVGPSIHRRRGLQGRLQRSANRRALGVSGRQPYGMVGSNGPGHHGQRGPAGARGGIDQQFLPHRSGHRQGLRPGYFHVRQPGGSVQR